LLFYALSCKPLKTLGQIGPKAIGERFKMCLLKSQRIYIYWTSKPWNEQYKTSFIVSISFL
jgi:hypothetical protein